MNLGEFQRKILKLDNDLPVRVCTASKSSQILDDIYEIKYVAERNCYVIFTE